jgi:4-hydroxybenzoate polyprenyltransferase
MNKYKSSYINFNNFLIKIINLTKLMRLHSPVGFILLAISTFIAIIFNAKLLNIKLLELKEIIYLFMLGALIMRSAGCVINDIFDKKFDQKVNRTKNRPIASENVSKKEAIILLTILSTIGLTILLQFNNITILAGAIIAIAIIIYPLCKRFTFYPQIFLGITFNSSILLSALAIKSQITLIDIFLYFALTIWTIIYDTIYAFQDIKDDVTIGVKSIAIKIHNKKPKIILKLLALLMFILLMTAGHLANFNAIYIIINLIATLILMAIIDNCDLEKSNKIANSFKANQIVGLFMILAILLG